jgi:hypothetical protein
MGYSHYFTIKTVPPQEVWDQFVEATQDIVKYAKENGIALDDRSKDNVIDINGLGAESHENLLIDPDYLGFEFCKTNGKPYDIVVVAVLSAMSDIVGNYYVEIGSDGNPGDWTAGLALATNALGYAIPLPEGVAS